MIYSNRRDFSSWPQDFSFERLYKDNIESYLNGSIGLQTLRLRNKINFKHLKDPIYMDCRITGWKLIDEICVIK